MVVTDLVPPMMMLNSVSIYNHFILVLVTPLYESHHPLHFLNGCYPFFGHGRVCEMHHSNISTQNPYPNVIFCAYFSYSLYPMKHNADGVNPDLILAYILVLTIAVLNVVPANGSC